MSEAADPGLQAERTALAWRRICLALLAGSLVGTRLLGDLLGAWAAAFGLAGAVAAGALFVAVERRFAARRRGGAGGSPLAGGRLIAALAAAVLLAGLAVALVVVVIAVRGRL